MRLVFCLLAIVLAILTCSSASAFGGRRGSCGPVGCSPTVAAHPVAHAVGALTNTTAQGVANLMAHHGRVGHFGGNRGCEGCGMAGTQQAAYSICCFANSGMQTIDVGYARGANGQWYCCRRYR